MKLDLTDAEKRFRENANRVRNLVELYRGLNVGQAGKPLTAKSDVLRASVVLLHAAIEEFLRELARVGLVDGSPETLAKIPIVGSEGRAEKFDLGSLSKFKDESVTELIRKSISEHMGRTTYNNPGNIKTLLAGVQIAPNDDGCSWDVVGNLMARRHKIVHEADRNPKAGRGHSRSEPLSQVTVNKWIKAVEGLVKEILDANRDGHEPQGSS